MTREEAIKWLDELYTRADITDEYGDMEDMQPYGEALDMAIKALEQESILDKIRAEIEEHAKINQNLNADRARTLCWCLDVFDKYKAENEDILADTIQGEINRMRVTNNLAEFDTMYGHAKRNIEKLSRMIYDSRFKAESEDKT